MNRSTSNHDLVFFTRVPGYRRGEWQTATYRDRLIYDGWDKQACLVRMRKWPVRRIYDARRTSSPRGEALGGGNHQF